MSGWKPCLVAGVLCALSAAPGRAASTWIEQGPGPIFNGSTEGLPGNPVAGAINAIATVPGDPDMLYVGAVNGGVWLTLDATSPAPIWTPLTDEALPALSIASLAVSPVNSSVVFAGTGSTSSLSDQGSPGFGVARSTDGGETWSVLAESTFAGQRIVAIVPTTLGGGSVVLAATRPIPVETTSDLDTSINGVTAAAGAADPPTYG
ncbi:MAG TPA: hypothetical protein VE993_18300, partial [Stellaceae bacterium]|nr:hypothetical protein [Stellaceae bacterium]